MTSGEAPAAWRGLYHPIAGRSCRISDKRAGLGGEWVDVDSPVGMSIDGDYDALYDMLDEQEGALLFAELEELLEQAERGLLHFEGRCGPEVDPHVKRMSLDPRVLELRLGPRQTAGLAQILTRVYFTEPAGPDRVLLLLHVNAKNTANATKSEQNNHIGNAGRRLDSHRW